MIAIDSLTGLNCGVFCVSTCNTYFMRTEVLGADDTHESPTVAAIGAIHGDEPCGARAIERFLATGLQDRLQRPIKLIIANERALAASSRYVEVDLNRSFPGDAESDLYEERLAHRLWSEIKGCVTLGFHSTVSFDSPFGTFADPTFLKSRIMRALPIEHAADFSAVAQGRSVNLPRFVNVEAGYQQSEAAAETAYECLLAYLRAMGALPDSANQTSTMHYLVQTVIEKSEKQDYTICAENFQRVAPGEVYATTDQGQTLTADKEFWPVLMSADGHDVLLGYQADQLGEISQTIPE
jgi:succinylglutamate desuccinylase